MKLGLLAEKSLLAAFNLGVGDVSWSKGCYFSGFQALT